VCLCIVTHFFDAATVNHAGDIVDGNGRLGDVGGDDDLEGERREGWDEMNELILLILRLLLVLTVSNIISDEVYSNLNQITYSVCKKKKHAIINIPW